MFDLANTFVGVGAVVVGAFLTAGGYWWKGHQKVRSSEAGIEQTKDLELREMVATMYSGLVTAPPTAMNPHPGPGLINRVESMDDRLNKLQAQQDHVAKELGEHRLAVSDALAKEQSNVKALLDLHSESDAASFEAINAGMSSLTEALTDWVTKDMDGNVTGTIEQA